MNFGGTIRLNKFGVCIVTALLFLLIFYITTSYKNDSEKKNVVSLKKLLIASIETAIKGGKQVVDAYKGTDLKERVKGKTKEGANELVTSADERSNCVMYYSLTHAYPEIKVISEENSPESACRANQNLDFDQNVLESTNELDDEEVLVSDVKVWIDPLDATQEFTEKLLEYVTTMVCVAVKGEPIIGVIHFPFGDEPRTTWAWVGKGVSSDIKKKSSRTVDESVKSFIVSRSHQGEVENVVKNAFGNVIIIPAGGAGYKSLEVASKNVTAYVHTTDIKKWDICAGNAILNALNGHMTTLKNEKITYGSPEEIVNHNGLLATLNDHEQILDKLKLILKN